jgi:hypothetical protein
MSSMPELIEQRDIPLETPQVVVADFGNVAGVTVSSECDLEYIDLFALDSVEDISQAPTMTKTDCELLIETVIGMYEEDKVVLSNAAEKFLSRTREIQRSAEFHGLFAEAAKIEAMIHARCGEDHGLRTALQNEEAAHSENDGHNHPESELKKDKKHDKDCKAEVGGKCSCKK